MENHECLDELVQKLKDKLGKTKDKLDKELFPNLIKLNELFDNLFDNIEAINAVFKNEMEDEGFKPKK